MKASKPVKALIPQDLAENKKTIKSYYLELSEKYEDSSLIKHSAQVVEKVIEILGLVNDDTGKLLISFKKLIDPKSSENWPKFKEFYAILATWMANNKILTAKEVQAQKDILQHLEKSIKQYQVLCKISKDPEEINLSKQVLELLLNSKKKIKAAYQKEEVKFSQRTQPTAQELKSVQEVFNFYAKQHIMTGRNPTFDMLGEIVENMDSGSFLYFTKHFDLCSNKKVESKRYLTKDEILKVFKHCATLQKAMNLQGFNSALDELAELYFNEEYERLVHFKCSSLEIERKRIMLYEVLKFDSAKYVNKTCMPIRTPFGPSHDKIIKPTIGKKVLGTNEEEKEIINRYKKEKKSKKIAIIEEKGKESMEKAKIADIKIKEKKEQEDLKKRKDVFRMEDLDKAKLEDFDEENQLDELLDDD